MPAFLTVILIGIALSMDAFSVSIISGIRSSKPTLKLGARVGLYFGIFQALMPLVGYAIGKTMQEIINSYTSPIAFALLFIVGLKMIYESFQSTDDMPRDLSTRTLLGLSVATSIDALVVGTTLALIQLPILISCLIIGVITFLISTVGYKFGSHIGKIFGKRIEIVGGLVLIGIGINFLL